ncbi:MAG: thiamine pyrophosphate-binding protein, partial [Burkholderiales bacterium]
MEFDKTMPLKPPKSAPTKETPKDQLPPKDEPTVPMAKAQPAPAAKEQPPSEPPAPAAKEAVVAAKPIAPAAKEQADAFKPETAADAWLGLLAARGIEYLFANGGTDFAPVVEAYAKGQKLGWRLPQIVIVPHENMGVAMAHGYAMVTGRPQAMMVHVGVGTANSLNGLINASRQNVPILFTAGRTPLTESGALPAARNNYIHWAQEHFD